MVCCCVLVHSCPLHTLTTSPTWDWICIWWWYYSITKKQSQQMHTPMGSWDCKKVVGTMKNEIKFYSLVDDIDLWRLLCRHCQSMLTISSLFFVWFFFITTTMHSSWNLTCFFCESLKTSYCCDDAQNKLILKSCIFFSCGFVYERKLLLHNAHNAYGNNSDAHNALSLYT